MACPTRKGGGDMIEAMKKAFLRRKLRKAERLKNRKMVKALFRNGIIRKA